MGEGGLREGRPSLCRPQGQWGGRGRDLGAPACPSFVGTVFSPPGHLARPGPRCPHLGVGSGLWNVCDRGCPLGWLCLGWEPKARKGRAGGEWTDTKQLRGELVHLQFLDPIWKTSHKRCDRKCRDTRARGSWSWTLGVRPWERVWPGTPLPSGGNMESRVQGGQLWAAGEASTLPSRWPRPGKGRRPPPPPPRASPAAGQTRFHQAREASPGLSSPSPQTLPQWPDLVTCLARSRHSGEPQFPSS